MIVYAAAQNGHIELSSIAHTPYKAKEKTAGGTIPGSLKQYWKNMEADGWEIVAVELNPAPATLGATTALQNQIADTTLDENACRYIMKMMDAFSYNLLFADATDEDEVILRGMRETYQTHRWQAGKEDAFIFLVNRVQRHGVPAGKYLQSNEDGTLANDVLAAMKLSGITPVKRPARVRWSKERELIESWQEERVKYDLRHRQKRALPAEIDLIEFGVELGAKEETCVGYMTDVTWYKVTLNPDGSTKHEKIDGNNVVWWAALPDSFDKTPYLNDIE